MSLPWQLKLQLHDNIMGRGLGTGGWDGRLYVLLCPVFVMRGRVG